MELVRADQPHEIREMSLLVHVDQVDENRLLVRADQGGNFRAARRPMMKGRDADPCHSGCPVTRAGLSTTRVTGLSTTFDS